MTQHRS